MQEGSGLKSQFGIRIEIVTGATGVTEITQEDLHRVRKEKYLRKNTKERKRQGKVKGDKE